MFLGSPLEYFEQMSMAYGSLVPKISRSEYEAFPCNGPSDVLVFSSGNPGKASILDSVRRGNVVTFYYSDSVEEGLFYCERQMVRDCFYMGGNTITDYKILMDIWDGRVEYSATGNIMTTGLRKNK